MKKYKVVLTDYMYDSVEPFFDVYNKEADIEFLPMQLKTKEEMMKETEFADAVQIHFNNLDRDIINNLKNCKVIARSAVGVDNIDIEAATAKGIPVVNVPDYCLEEVSDHAILLMMYCTKKMNLLINTVKEGTWDYAVTKPVFSLRNMTLGLLGCGNIARSVAKKAQALGMKVIASDPFVKQDDVSQHSITIVTQDELIKNSDVISLHIPLTEKTSKTVNADFLSKMKKSAYLINTARGGLVDEAALRDALAGNIIAGAGLDVLVKEEISKDDPLLALENCIITPHAAWYSEESVYTLLTSAAKEVVRCLHDERPVNQVNKI